MTRRVLFYKWFWYLMAIVPLCIAEDHVFHRLRLFGVAPVLLPLAAVAAAMLEGPAAGGGYGLAVGLLYRVLPKRNRSVYTALIGAMLAGRVVWGVVAKLLYSAMGMDFTWQVFVAGAFLNAIPGIIVHIVLIPAVVIALKKAKIMN